MLSRLILSGVLLVLAARAAAFESWEHRRLSDLAYHVAVQIHCPEKSDDELCGDLRPESRVNLRRDGALSAWCRENASTPACIKLAYLYRAPPEAQYLASKLAISCSDKNKKEPACAEVATILNDRDAAEPVNYSAKKEILRWCIKTPAIKTFAAKSRTACASTRAICVASLQRA